MPEEMSEEKKDKAKAFLEAFKTLAKEHGFDFQCSLSVTETGTVPQLRVIDLPKQE